MHQFGIARNAKRRMNVNAIIKATQQYIIDYETFPVFMGGALIDDTVKNICRTNASVIECIFGNNGAYLATLSATGDYFSDIPVDPTKNAECECLPGDCAGCWDTGYTITIDNNGHIIVTAPETEGNGSDISITR